MLTLLGRKKYEETMSDEQQPPKSITFCSSVIAFLGCEKELARAFSSRKAVSKISTNFGNCDEVYFQKKIISTTNECALKKNSAVIVFLYCDINQLKQGTLLLKLPWFKFPAHGNSFSFMDPERFLL